MRATVTGYSLADKHKGRHALLELHASPLPEPLLEVPPYGE